jgi:hypothetical protein
MRAPGKFMRNPPQSEPVQPMALPPRDAAIDTATLDLLAMWQREDATSDPDQIRAAEQELAEFKRAINDARATSDEQLVYL